jgi:uncharacterized protein YecE (DUF72 family)
MPMVYAGTSGWAYSSWKPDFYPAKLSPAKFLSYYATRLNTVELNYTFRHFPSRKLLGNWVEGTPANFKFAVKAHQKITHVLRLQDAAPLALDFMAALQPMKDAGKLGPVLFQLPPFLKCDLTRLQGFLAGLPRDVRATFEFRHESWFDESVFAALRQANAALCVAESEKLKTPEVQTADFCYLRLRKEKYSAGEQKQLAKRVAELARKADVFVYFKHEDTPEGAVYAEKLLGAAAENPQLRPA